MISYRIPADGTAAPASDFFPPASVIDPNPPAHGDGVIGTLADVISHYTRSSLATDNITIVPDSLRVVESAPPERQYTVTFAPAPGSEKAAQDFATMQGRIFSDACAGRAIVGAALMRATPGAWNPMEGFKVNAREVSRWHLFLPLGMPVANHRAVTLLHYPPYVAMQGADYLHNMTLDRWRRLLGCVGIAQAEQSLYYAIVDVNPIAAPGSGESEYPNDYFPIMMSSAFFDADEATLDGRTVRADYIRSMLEVMLNPPHNAANPYTLPLLVGGSPLYDPQAPGWFRVRYKADLPQVNGIPQAEINQAGLIRINKESRKQTPYMIANHMIAAGVTGCCCTSNTGARPDIRVYEAQDLVAASFLAEYAKDPSVSPAVARATACTRWFGNAKGEGSPAPASADDKLSLCALAQMDLFFDAKRIAPVYSWDQAVERCRTLTGGTFDPCSADAGGKWSSCGPTAAPSA
jgi:hypothetical protein